MTRIAGEVTIDAPVSEVFDFVADERNEPRYNPRIVSAELVGGGPVGVGTQVAADPRGMGPRGRMVVTTVEYDRPRHLRNAIESPYMRIDGTLTFEEVGSGTRLAWDWDMALLGPMRLLTPVLALIGPRWERRNWVDLKRYLETQAISGT